jgi:Flp pilus assembly protein TadG
MVTAEMAVALPVLMLLVLTAVYAVQVMGMRVRCLDAAREVARAAARGDPRAAAIGREVLPGASVSIRRSDGALTAVVAIRLHPLGRDLPSVTVREQVTAATEPNATAADLPTAQRLMTPGNASDLMAIGRWAMGGPGT